MKTIIVYYSFTGNNEFLMRKLRERLQCDTLKIEEKWKRNGFSILLDLVFKRIPRLKRYDVQLSNYDHVVMVAPVWAGKIATPLQAFLLRERKNIRNYSFITLCGGGEGQKQKISAALESVMLNKPVALEELWVNDILLPDQRDKIKFTTAYRAREEDWKVFNAKMNAFVGRVRENAKSPEIARDMEVIN